MLESCQQIYTYDTANNLITLSHQAQSNAWQQTINIHPNNNRGTETQQSTANFDANGNLSTLNNIGTLDWCYNNTLNKFTKKDNNTTEYHVYDHQGNRVRTVLESNQTIQRQRNYLPSLDISTNENKQQTNTLHIGAHILAETTKDTIGSRYQLANHLQSNTLELNDKANIISYEHYYPYGGTALIAGKDQIQVRQKRYRYTDKERDDSSGLSYYGARYLAPWMARWISPDSAGTVDGLNLYVYVDNNPLKYLDPTGHATVLTFPYMGSSYEFDVLSPINQTFQGGNLFNSHAAYQRLEEVVGRYSAIEYGALDTNTIFFILEDTSKIRSTYSLEQNNFINTMDFSTGEFTFEANFIDRNTNLGLNATQVASYQYLGMTKIVGALNMLPKTLVRNRITNKAANTIINAYKENGDYPEFKRFFVGSTDNGRSSSRVADALGLNITSIELNRTINSVRLYLEQQQTLRPIGEPLVLPPRENMDHYSRISNRLGRTIRRQKNHCNIL